MKGAKKIMKLTSNAKTRLSFLERAASWIGAVSLILVSLAPIPALASTAGVLDTRSVTPSSSLPAATGVTLTSVFNIGQTANVGTIKFEICDSPLAAVSCVNSGNSTGESFTSGPATTTGCTGTNAASFVLGVSGQASTANTLYMTRTSASATAGNTWTCTINAAKNPTTTNVQYYMKITTYNEGTGVAPTTVRDFGGIAMATTQQISVTANVQENLVFCVGTSGATSGTPETCGTFTGSTVTLSPNPMANGAASTGIAKMTAATNGLNGYNITYNGSSFTDTTADTITAFPVGGAVNNSATAEQFGFNLMTNTTPAVGVGATGSASGTAFGTYATANTFSYSTAGGVKIASATQPTADTLYTMAYVANVLATTKAGAYTATQTFICTGNF